MWFRIVIVCLVIAAAYAAFEISTAWRFYNRMYHPESSFTVINEGNKTSLTIVEFMNYDCWHCRGTHTSLMAYAKANPDVRVVVRPFPNVGGYAEEAAGMALAAGLQGKFFEMDEAIVEYLSPPDERFYRETAGLLGLDYDKMLSDAQGPVVQEMLTENAGAVLRSGVVSVPALMIGKTLHEFDKALTLHELISMVAAERAR